MITDFSLSNIDCHIYCEGTPNVVFYWGTAKGHTDMTKVIELIKKAGGKDYLLCAYEVNDWNAGFSPWPAPPVFGKEGFRGEAQRTIDFLKDKLIPYVELSYPGVLSARKVIAGYSLAGLFSLWTALNGHFDYAISCSGSLWFPGWTEFIGTVTSLSADSDFYLSLGDKESKTKNKIMANVEENTVITVDALKTCSSCTFEWNKGGHFADSEERMTKGFLHFILHNNL